MKNVKVILAATLAAATLGAIGMQTLSAQQAGFKRVELQRGDLSVAGREAVVMRVEFDADGIVGRHTHPGEESTYILEGNVLIEIDGKAPMTLGPGETFFVPAGVIHGGKNVGKTPAKLLATYIVEKGKPLGTPAK